MTADGHSVASLHGSKDTGDRDAIIDGFREGKTKVLITTNVIARGIDISQVTMVINYDIPTTGFGGQARADTETYLHRVGKSGPSDSTSTVSSILTPVHTRTNGSIRSTGSGNQLYQRCQLV